MSGLAAEPIVLCKRGTAPLSVADIATLLQEVPTWSPVLEQAVTQLQRCFLFKNFVDALLFANVVGDLAEAANHHPALLLEWGKVNVSWWTHTIQGLHRNDFILAARCDQAYLATASPIAS
jgi:4a-hydroxytetrahydrobiopterin dehydratase